MPADIRKKVCFLLLANSSNYCKNLVIKSYEMAQKDIDCDPIEFWIAMNMMYSDYYLVAKKFNMNTPDFYAEMAKAFLDDKDVQDNKLMNYFSYVVK